MRSTFTLAHSRTLWTRVTSSLRHHQVRHWLVRAAAVALLLACTLSGSDTDGRNHKCLIDTDQAWDNWNLLLDHNDPRTCPVIISGHSGSEDVKTFSGDAVDRNGVHDGSAIITVLNADNVQMQQVAQPWLYDAPDFVAQFSVNYHAGTGGYDGQGADTGDVWIPLKYNNVDIDAHADVNLTVCNTEVQPCLAT